MAKVRNWRYKGSSVVSSAQCSLQKSIYELFNGACNKIQGVQIFDTIPKHTNHAKSSKISLPVTKSVSESLRTYFLGSLMDSEEHFTRTVLTSIPEVLVLIVLEPRDDMTIDEQIDLSQFMLHPKPAIYSLTIALNEKNETTMIAPSIIIYEKKPTPLFELIKENPSRCSPGDVFAGCIQASIDWSFLEPDQELISKALINLDAVWMLQSFIDNEELVKDVIEADLYGFIGLLKDFSNNNAKKSVFEKCILSYGDHSFLLEVAISQCDDSSLNLFLPIIAKSDISGDEMIYQIMSSTKTISKCSSFIKSAIQRGISENTIEFLKNTRKDWRSLLITSQKDKYIPYVTPLKGEDYLVLMSLPKDYVLKLLKQGSNSDLILKMNSSMKSVPGFNDLLKSVGFRPAIISMLFKQNKYQEIVDTLFQNFPGKTLNKETKDEVLRVTTKALENVDSHKYFVQIYDHYLESFMEDKYVGAIIITHAWNTATCKKDYLPTLELALKQRGYPESNITHLSKQISNFSTNNGCKEILLRSMLKYPDLAIRKIIQDFNLYISIEEEHKLRYFEDLYKLSYEQPSEGTVNVISYIFMIYEGFDITRFKPGFLFETHAFEFKILSTFKYFQLPQLSSKIRVKYLNAIKEIEALVRILRTTKGAIISPKIRPDDIHLDIQAQKCISVINSRSHSDINSFLNFVKLIIPYSYAINKSFASALSIGKLNSLAKQKENVKVFCELIETIVRYGFADVDIIANCTTQECIDLARLPFSGFAQAAPTDWEAALTLIPLCRAIIRNEDLCKITIMEQFFVLEVIPLEAPNLDMINEYLNLVFEMSPDAWNSKVITAFCNTFAISKNIGPRIKLLITLYLNSKGTDHIYDLDEAVSATILNEDLPETQEFFSIIE